MGERTTRASPTDNASASNENLSYRVELWDRGGDSLKRVLARAANSQLARAIFTAAQKEHPDGRILLLRGTRKMADSAE